MAEFASALKRKHDIPVVDGVGAAVGLAKTLIRCGLVLSKLACGPCRRAQRNWTGSNDPERYGKTSDFGPRKENEITVVPNPRSSP
ncbi:hypothetical protein [Mesorhizobium amorphae]|uniref:hypothetical protein n=1 Tax=Mesorhizobium amorphae TaxID=71433 RepID=UPI001FEF80D1|nr:hypothetical protein [Mesorhizobium amorphae]